MPAKPAPRRPAPRAPRPTPRGTDAELDALLALNTPTGLDTFDPGYVAHLMRVAGRPWPEIATRIGSPNPAGAMQVASKYLQKAAAAQSATQMQEALQTQVDRYETILAKWWEKAVTDLDVGAAGVVLRALERLDRILRLTDSEIATSMETVVVSADPTEYAKQLQRLVADRAKQNGKSEN